MVGDQCSLYYTFNFKFENFVNKEDLTYAHPAVTCDAYMNTRTNLCFNHDFRAGVDFDKEYPTIQIKPNPDCHDRFIVLDYGTNTEKVYHCGASSKDAGRKVCAINAIENTLLIHPIIDNLLLNPDKVL